MRNFGFISIQKSTVERANASCSVPKRLRRSQINSIQQKLERPIRLAAKLRTKSEQHHASASVPSFHQRLLPMRLPRAGDPSASEQVFGNKTCYAANLAVAV